MQCARRYPVLKETGLQIKDLEKGEVMLLEGGFAGRKHGIIPYAQTKKMVTQGGKLNATMCTLLFAFVESTFLPQLCTWGVGQVGGRIGKRAEHDVNLDSESESSPESELESDMDESMSMSLRFVSNIGFGKQSHEP